MMYFFMVMIAILLGSYFWFSLQFVAWLKSKIAKADYDIKRLVYPGVFSLIVSFICFVGIALMGHEDAASNSASSSSTEHVAAVQPSPIPIPTVSNPDTEASTNTAIEEKYERAAARIAKESQDNSDDSNCCVGGSEPHAPNNPTAAEIREADKLLGSSAAEESPK